MLGFILYLLVIGLVAGFLARLLVPGPDPMGILGTIVLGIVGSFVGGFLGYVLFGEDVAEGALQPAGVIGSIIGAVIALLDLPVRQPGPHRPQPPPRPAHLTPRSPVPRAVRRPRPTDRAGPARVPHLPTLGGWGHPAVPNPQELTFGVRVSGRWGGRGR